MKIDEIIKLVKDNGSIIIEFTDAIHEYDTDLDPRQRAVLYDIKVDSEDANWVCHELFINLTDFEKYNDKFRSHDYYDKNEVPCLTGKEAGFYKNKTSFYIDVNTNNGDVPWFTCQVKPNVEYVLSLLDDALKCGLKIGYYINETGNSVIDLNTLGKSQCELEIKTDHILAKMRYDNNVIVKSYEDILDCVESCIMGRDYFSLTWLNILKQNGVINGNCNKV